MSIAMHSYEALRSALVSAGVYEESAELHGGVCAGLCIGGLSAADAWSEAWLGAGADTGVSAHSAAARTIVRELEDDSWNAMNDGEFSLELILPEEEAELSDRIASLAAWCHGFVAGLGVGGLNLAEHAPAVRDELEEIIADFTEISRASTDVEDVVEGGFQLASIVEFVRAGVQIVFESLAEQRTTRASGRYH
jgi:uncharacterized protein YgfB (UPF0149 family)